MVINPDKDSGHVHPHKEDGFDSVPPSSPVPDSPEELEQIMTYYEEARHQCECSCHGSGGTIMHIVACCSACPYCRLRIRRGGIRRHLQRLHPDKVEEYGDRG